MGLPAHSFRAARGHDRCTSRTLSVILVTMLALCILSPAVMAQDDGNIDIDYEPDYLVMDPDTLNAKQAIQIAGARGVDSMAASMATQTVLLWRGASRKLQWVDLRTGAGKLFGT